MTKRAETLKEINRLRVELVAKETELIEHPEKLSLIVDIDYIQAEIDRQYRMIFAEQRSAFKKEFN